MCSNSPYPFQIKGSEDHPGLPPDKEPGGTDLNCNLCTAGKDQIPSYLLPRCYRNRSNYERLLGIQVLGFRCS